MATTVGFCPQLGNRTNLLGTGFYCYMLDSSHPGVAARYGPCESYVSGWYDVDGTVIPGFVRLCVWDSARSRCVQGQCLTCSDAPSAPPPSPSPSPPLPAPPSALWQS